MRDHHVFVVSRKVFRDERCRRWHIALARKAARRFGYRGRVSFATYPVPGPPLGRDAIEIRVHP